MEKQRNQNDIVENVYLIQASNTEIKGQIKI